MLGEKIKAYRESKKMTQKDIAEILEMVKQEFYKTATDQMISDVLTQQFFNLTKYSFEQLS